MQWHSNIAYIYTYFASYTDGKQRVNIAHLSFQRAPTNWHQLGGDFVLPSQCEYTYTIYARIHVYTRSDRGFHGV